MIVISLILFFIILIVALISLHNKIIRNDNAVKRGWASVITQEREKNKLLPSLEKEVSRFYDHESDVLTKITSLRAAIDGLSETDINHQTLSEVEKLSKQLHTQFSIIMENYPELKASDVTIKMMDQLANQQANISAALRIFNQNVELFNNAIMTFPGSLINKSFAHKTPYQPFYDDQANEGFDYHPTKN